MLAAIGAKRKVKARGEPGSQRLQQGGEGAPAFKGGA